MLHQRRIFKPLTTAFSPVICSSKKCTTLCITTFFSSFLLGLFFGLLHRIMFIDAVNVQCILQFFIVIHDDHTLSFVILGFFPFLCMFFAPRSHCISRLNNNDNMFLRIMVVAHLHWVELNCLLEIMLCTLENLCGTNRSFAVKSSTQTFFIVMKKKTLYNT